MTDSFEVDPRDNHEKGPVSFLVGAAGGMGNCLVTAVAGIEVAGGGGDHGTAGSFPAKPIKPPLGDRAGSVGFSSAGGNGGKLFDRESAEMGVPFKLSEVTS